MKSAVLTVHFRFTYVQKATRVSKTALLRRSWTGHLCRVDNLVKLGLSHHAEGERSFLQRCSLLECLLGHLTAKLSVHVCARACVCVCVCVCVRVYV